MAPGPILVIARRSATRVCAEAGPVIDQGEGEGAEEAAAKAVAPAAAAYRVGLTPLAALKARTKLGRSA